MDSFASIIWAPPYAIHRRQMVPVLIELREALRPLGRLICVHYFDPGSFLQRSMRLLYKAYYDLRGLGGVLVLVVLEKLPAHRIPPKRQDRLVPVPLSLWEPEPLQESLAAPPSSMA